jgi:hypothetical protein
MVTKSTSISSALKNACILPQSSSTPAAGLYFLRRLH